MAMDAAQMQALREKIETTVTRFFERYHSPKLVYHNLEHTQRVVARTEEIAAHYPLSEDERFVLHAAAWWHDAGQLFAEPSVHEEKSIEFVSAFFSLHRGAPPQIIVAVERAILATKMPQVPCSLVEEILCDADTYHFGTEDFQRTNELVLHEMVLRINCAPEDWNAASLRLLREHSFHTTYCREKLAAGKELNMAELAGQ